MSEGAQQGGWIPAEDEPIRGETAGCDGGAARDLHNPEEAGRIPDGGSPDRGFIVPAELAYW